MSRDRLRRLGRNLILGASVLLASMSPVGCSERPPEQGESDSAQALETITYTVRGIVAELPDPAIPTATFKVRHEPMPHYDRGDGTLGMNAMTMPFPPGPELSLDGVEVGQKVQLTFEVDYLEVPESESRRVTAFRATAVEALPVDTVLNFENPPRPSGNE